MSTKVLVVDDSALSRRWLLNALATDPEFVVVGTAADGLEALGAAQELRPDIITLDLNMPVMDGLSALKRLMSIRPTRTVIVSHLAVAESRLTFDCLRYGAVDFMVKPSGLDDSATEGPARAITLRLRRAAAVAPSWLRFRRLRRRATAAAPQGRDVAARLIVAVAGQSGMADLLQAVAAVPRCSDLAFVALLDASPSVTESFATYAAEFSMLSVRPWTADALVLGGGVYFASASESILPTLEGTLCRLKGFKAPLGSDRESLSAAVLTSAAETFGPRLHVVLLSGARAGGPDTLDGLRRKGVRVWAQDYSGECGGESLGGVGTWTEWAEGFTRGSR